MHAIGKTKSIQHVEYLGVIALAFKYAGGFVLYILSKVICINAIKHVFIPMQLLVEGSLNAGGKQHLWTTSLMCCNNFLK